MRGTNSPGGKGPGPMRYAGLGVQLTASILVFVFLGQWLDRKFSTGGLFTILGAFLGFGGTMWSLIRSLKQDEKDGE
ncbi:MAG: AtpZ/AtpI family protein [Gemmatimonadales bacterium]